MLKGKPQKIPTQPGVYFFKDTRGRVLYIGKAASLKNRLASYFRKPRRPKGVGVPTEASGEPKVAAMLEKAVKVAWQETDSEIEALILEAQLIKKHRTPFNILMRDDKQYAYVVFTKEEFPRIYVTHQPDSTYKNINVSLTIGPFTETWGLKETLKLLRRVFPYCTCEQAHNNYCLNYHIGKCLGYCCLKNSEERPVDSGKKKLYQKNIQAIKDILSGKRKTIAKQLEKAMRIAGKTQNFESAIQLQQQLRQLNRVFENAYVIHRLEHQQNALQELQQVLRLTQLPNRIECYDIANIQGSYATGAMVVFTNGQPDKNQYRKFRIRRKTGGDTAMLGEMLERRFNHPEWPNPDLIIVDGGKAQLNSASRVILPAGRMTLLGLVKNKHHRGSHVLIAGREKPLKLTELPVNGHHLIEQIDAEAHRFAIEYYRQLHRQTIAKRP